MTTQTTFHNVTITITAEPRAAYAELCDILDTAVRAGRLEYTTDTYTTPTTWDAPEDTLDLAPTAAEDEKAMMPFLYTLSRRINEQWSDLRATVEYPGYVSIAVATGPEPGRTYNTGVANPTWTVDQSSESGADVSRDTEIPVDVSTNDPAYLAAAVVTAIEEMEASPRCEDCDDEISSDNLKRCAGCASRG